MFLFYNYLRKISLLLSFATMVGCGKYHLIYFYSPDKSQIITVIDKDDIRYIIPGKHNRIPDSNYIKLGVGHIDRTGDGIHICWRNNQYEWDIVVHKAIIKESKLDESKYKFSNSLPLDSRGLPTIKKYSKESCAVFDYELMRLIPDNRETIVEIQ